jgi:hypothetical protein
MNFYSCSIVNDPLHSFFRIPPHRSAENLFPQDETTLAMLEQELGAQKWNKGIRSLNKMQEGIIKLTTQFPDGSPIEPKGISSKWRNDWGVLVREKFKVTWIDWGVVLVNEKEALW